MAPTTPIRPATPKSPRPPVPRDYPVKPNKGPTKPGDLAGKSATCQDAQATPVYFVREPSDLGAWREATREAFLGYPEKFRRILYAAPLPPAQPAESGS